MDDGAVGVLADSPTQALERTRYQEQDNNSSWMLREGAVRGQAVLMAAVVWRGIAIFN